MYIAIKKNEILSTFRSVLVLDLRFEIEEKADVYAKFYLSKIYSVILILEICRSSVFVSRKRMIRKEIKN